jgi:hypothetical protein
MPLSKPAALGTPRLGDDARPAFAGDLWSHSSGHPAKDGVLGKGGHTLQEHLPVSSLVPRMTLLRRLFENLS